jgi:hypothetical protein
MPATAKKAQKQRKAVVKSARKPETALAVVPQLSLSEKIEKVLIGGDLSPLTPEERVDYSKKVCLSIGLNPMTRPFDYILFKEFEGGSAKLSLYANKSAAEQLRKMHGVSVVKSEKTIENDCAIYEVTVQDRTGRTDSAAGIVPLFRFKDGKRIDFTGREWANAVMKAHTKAKRRATLSICGLAFLDESELDTMRVVGGVTPDGRIFRYENHEVTMEPARQLDETAAHGHEKGSTKAQIAENTLAKVEEEDRRVAEERAKKAAKPAEAPKEAAKPPKGRIELDFTDSPDEVHVILRFADEALLNTLQNAIDMKWRDDWWHFAAKDAPKVRQIAEKEGYEVVTVTPQRKEEKSKASGSGAGPTADTQSTPSTGPTILAGTIQHFTEKMTTGARGKGSKPYLNVLLKTEAGDRWYSVFDRDLFDFLTKGKGKAGEFLVRQSGDYWNVVGIKRIGNTEFEDGKLPVLNPNREPGTKPLF